MNFLLLFRLPLNNLKKVIFAVKFDSSSAKMCFLYTFKIKAFVGDHFWSPKIIILHMSHNNVGVRVKNIGKTNTPFPLNLAFRKSYETVFLSNEKKNTNKGFILSTLHLSEACVKFLGGKVYAYCSFVFWNVSMYKWLCKCSPIKDSICRSHDLT